MKKLEDLSLWVCPGYPDTKDAKSKTNTIEVLRFVGLEIRGQSSPSPFLFIFHKFAKCHCFDLLLSCLADLSDPLSFS